METIWKDIIWRQFGAAIDMLENAMRRLSRRAMERPLETAGVDQKQRPRVLVCRLSHAFLSRFYLSGSEKKFAPPAPFTLDELDSAGLLPDRPYTKYELSDLSRIWSQEVPRGHRSPQ